jgi:RNA polymerase sigma-70 factor (ECF subfamily)
MAQFAAANPDDALDIVQDAMLVFVRSYANKPESEWGALFHRTLQSRITDWQRRTTVRNRFRAWLGRGDGEEEEDPLHTVADIGSPDAEQVMLRRDMAAALEKAIRVLPLRQRQAFLAGVRLVEFCTTARSREIPPPTAEELPTASITIPKSFSIAACWRATLRSAAEGPRAAAPLASFTTAPSRAIRLPPLPY